ncbi:MAG TPA: NAD(P)-dependent oxidoreductase [Chloroflexota bacterium]|nr:NAD(P)-dependent oxidoreductase [Chloroflexota bacterium]
MTDRETAKPKVGYIGLGLMGRPMAENLLKAGFNLAVYNRTRSRAEGLDEHGATCATSIAELASQVDVLCSCVTGPSDVEEIYLGEGGVLSAVQPGALLIDMSTIDPATHRRIADAAKKRGCEYLDAPVSGGVTGAREGTLAIMVGGSAEAYERALPVLRAMGQHLYHCGPTGAGATAKLINQHMNAANALAACEGLIMGAKAGLNIAQLHELIMASSGASTSLRGLRQSAMAGNFEPGFTIDNMEKDVNLANQLARELGVRLLSGAVSGQVLREAQLSGLGSKGTAAQILPMERLAQAEVRTN